MTTNKPRIFIKKIQISNCGIFYGDNEIILSDSPEKNFTIIIADSGIGKSTIFKLIYWCLFGQHLDPKTEITASDEGIINLDKLKNLPIGENITASVTLSIYDQDGEKYVLTRSLIATNLRETNSRKFDQLNDSRINSGVQTEMLSKMKMEDEGGNMKTEKDQRIIKNEIKNIFPQNLSDFFLFDGEKLIKFREKSDAVDIIKNGIEKISGLPLLDSLIENAEETKYSIKKHIADKSFDSKGASALLETTKNEIKQKTGELNDKRGLLNQNQILYDQITNRIQKNKEGNKIQKSIKGKQNEKSELAKEINKNNNNFKNYVYEILPETLLRKTLEKSEEIFARLEDEDKIPPSITRGAIDKILGSNPLKCICDREFKKDDDTWEKLNKIKQVIIDEDISQGITQGRGLISQILDHSKFDKVREQYDENVETRRNNARTRIKLQGDIDDLFDDFKAVQFDEDEEDLGEQKKKLWSDISVLNSEINELEETLENKERIRKDQESKLDKILEHEKVHELELNKISIIKAVEKFAKERRVEIIDVLRANTEEATSKYFLESAPQKEMFDHVKISPKYDITACNSDDMERNLSKGQAHVLGLSYVTGCRQITSTNTFLFIDSPLHNISGIFRNEVSQVLAKYLPEVQIVLFVTDSEYLHGDEKGAEPVRSFLNPSNKVWKEYQIIKDKTNDGISCRKIEEYNRNA